MEKKEVELLIENGVRLEFTVEAAHLERGFNLYIARPGELDRQPFTTRRGEVRVFRSLEAVWGLVACDWRSDFAVKGWKR